jgi:hypothetical protein
MPSITTFNVTLDAEWGSDDPEVESIWILLKDAVSKLHDENIKDEADFRVDRIYEKLGEARNHYKSIRSDNFQSLPTSEQDAAYNSLYGSLWSAYKDRLIRFLSVIGYEAGAIVAGDKQYEAQMNAFCVRYPELNWLKQLIDGQKKNWQDTLRDNRNAKEHDGDLRDKKDLPNINTQLEAKKMFAYVCRSIECIAICLLSYKLPDHWNVEHINPNATVFDRIPRFSVEIPIPVPKTNSS